MECRGSVATRTVLRSAPDGGFVLVLVLCTMALAALVGAMFMQAVRANLTLASNAVEGSRVEAIADAGVHLAVFDLIAARADGTHRRRFAVDGTPVVCAMPTGGIVEIRVRDEAGKVDVNFADETLLVSVLQAAGLSETAAGAAVDRLRRRATTAPQSDLVDDSPPQGVALLQTLEELPQALGLDGSQLAKIAPFLTVYSGVSGLDPAAADPALIALLGQGGSSQWQSLMQPSFQRAFSVRVDARESSGARFVREAVADLAPDAAVPFKWRSWRRGRAAAPDVAVPTAPPCL